MFLLSTWSIPFMYRKSIFVIAGDQPFHLGGVHAAVGLGHVDDGHVQIGEDVGPHPQDGKEAAECDGDHRHHHGDRMPQAKFRAFMSTHLVCATSAALQYRSHLVAEFAAIRPNTRTPTN